MRWLVANIKWLMIVSGLLTCTMLYAAIAPGAALRATFGAELSGPLAEIVVRNWGVLIFLVGAMLIYAAGRPPLRPLALTVASLSKLAFVALVLAFGSAYLSHALVAVVIDCIWIVLFALYLLANRSVVRP
jgi:hypothetical protein